MSLHNVQGATAKPATASDAEAPWTATIGRARYALAANGSQTGEGNNQGERSAEPRKTSKPRPR